MEELILAVVTFVASIFIVGYFTHAGMDAPILFFVTFIASMLIVGYLACERGRSQSRWIYIAAIIGPFAIPALYLLAAISSFRKRKRAYL